MNELLKLKADLEQKAEQDYETNSDNYIEGELTDQDKETIEKLKAENSSVVVVEETRENGASIQQPISEYAKTLDERITEITDEAGNNEIIKTLNSGDIIADAEKLKDAAKAQALQAYRQLSRMSGSDQSMSDEEYISINNDAIQSLMNHFKLDRLTTENIIPRLKKMPLKMICSILPEEFVQIYVSKAEIIANNYKAKDRLLTVIGYLTVTGPEMDYLNEYIENENKLAMVSQRIFRSQMDIADMLKDERKLSELVAKTVEIVPNDASFWSKYIKLPNRVSNEFAQREVLQTEYKRAYTELLDEYPLDGSDDEFNQKARAVIQEEIDEADNKMKVYHSITNLDLLKELAVTLEERYRNHAKLSKKFLEQECISAIDRARRCKQDVPYPGYKGDQKKPEMIYKAYMYAYPAMIQNYNKAIADAYLKESENADTPPETTVVPVIIPDLDQETVIKTFSLLLSILMGRVMKKCTENTATKYDAIVLDSYFQLFCHLGTDIYVMTDVWNILKPLTEYIVKTVNPKW